MLGARDGAVRDTFSRKTCMAWPEGVDTAFSHRRFVKKFSKALRTKRESDGSSRVSVPTACRRERERESVR